MAQCTWCNQEMTDPATVTCTANQVVDFPDGKQLPAVPYQNEHYQDDDTHRCHDCGIKQGGLHHPGCDMEICPNCGWQIISCDCHDDEEYEEEE